MTGAPRCAWWFLSDIFGMPFLVFWLCTEMYVNLELILLKLYFTGACLSIRLCFNLKPFQKRFWWFPTWNARAFPFHNYLNIFEKIYWSEHLWEFKKSRWVHKIKFVTKAATILAITKCFLQKWLGDENNPIIEPLIKICIEPSGQSQINLRGWKTFVVRIWFKGDK